MRSLKFNAQNTFLFYTIYYWSNRECTYQAQLDQTNLDFWKKIHNNNSYATEDDDNWENKNLKELFQI